jgi:hypothetical protein
MSEREVLETFVTAGRWANVISKLGRKYDMARAKHLFAEDVLEEAALQVCAVSGWAARSCCADDGVVSGWAACSCCAD